ncbi:MAG: endo alpha-1,4 polygalactosaminidase [Polyangiaceae bacterium]|nr:endo alpha-1,4 polygalactosaminidase [Polyangiaceae bacterium]
MMNRIASWCGATLLAACVGCGRDSEEPTPDATGGATETNGGANAGGTTTGGAAPGGGSAGADGMVSGGVSTGGFGAAGPMTAGASGSQVNTGAAGGTDLGLGGTDAGGAAAAGASGGNESGGNESGGNESGGNESGGNESGGNESGAPSVGLPTANAPFDYQIGEAYPPPAGVAVISRDRESAPAAGLYSICYVNGYQTQPGEASFWLDSHAELVLRDGDGQPVEDEDWGEYLLDTGTGAKRAALAVIVGGWIERCARDGFDAVEIDNLDSYGRSDRLLTEDDNVAFMALLSGIAHDAGLAIAQKNSVELLGRVAEMGTDFAIAEECNRWDECGEYQREYGDLVYVIEYRERDFEAGCAAFPELSIVLRDLNVTAPGSGSYVYDGC